MMHTAKPLPENLQFHEIPLSQSLKQRYKTTEDKLSELYELMPDNMYINIIYVEIF